MTHVYRVYGRLLASDVRLLEIAAAAGAPEWRFGVGPIEHEDAAWFDIWPTDHATPWVRAARTPRGYRIRYEERAEFSIDRFARTIVCAPDACPADTMRHFLLDQVLPLTFSLEGVVLHASSVAVNATLAAFIGPGGAGKSTIALALARAGHAIGSDDGLAIDAALAATPSYPSIRVWEDSAWVAGRPASNAGAPATAKRQYRDGFVAVSESLPLARLYVLNPEPADAIRFDPISPRDAMMALVEQSYRLALDDRGALARELDALARLARQVPAWRLSSPRRLELWSELAVAVVDHVGSGAAFEVV